MELKDLRKSVTEMSTQELADLVTSIRTARRNIKKETASTSSGRSTKKSASTKKDEAAAASSEAMLAAMVAALPEAERLKVEAILKARKEAAE